ncbi:MAG TPA: tetratricopeptide repeat protein [Gaiellaceae bacterium]|nr:tetratricopeptide repeat protein [Gaiellaceae bacterium]
MFFPRLRRQAKWVFLFLALAFGLGFVGFGVGAGGVGVGDIFRGMGGDSGVPSVSDAEKRVAEDPRDPQALQDLATAHQAEGNTDEAIDALERYAEIRPKDAAALRELAGLYLSRASEAQQRAQEAQLRLAYLAPDTGLVGYLTFDGRPLTSDPITNAVTTEMEGAIATAYADVREASAKGVDTYKRIAAASPNDPSVQIELAQAAQSAGDAATAIGAYERFLELAPDDPSAPEVKRLLKQLRSLSATG